METENIIKKLDNIGIDLSETMFSLCNKDALNAIARVHGEKALILTKEQLAEALSLMKKGVEFALGECCWDILKAAAESISIPVRKVEINGIECLFSEKRREDLPEYDQCEAFPHVFDLRHGDDGEPCTIEKNVFVNYFGTILSPVDFLGNGEDHIDIRPCPECDGKHPDFVYLDE